MVYAFQWAPFCSQFTTLSISRHSICSCSIVRERHSAISIHRFLHRCQTNLHKKFQRHREFHTTKEKVSTKTNFFSCGRSVLLFIPYSWMWHTTQCGTNSYYSNKQRTHLQWASDEWKKLGRAQAFVNTFTLVVWTSQHWNFHVSLSVIHAGTYVWIIIAERRSHTILQLRMLCRLTESIINCERSGLHWKAYTISCVCWRRECSWV